MVFFHCRVFVFYVSNFICHSFDCTLEKKSLLFCKKLLFDILSPNFKLSNVSINLILDIQIQLNGTWSNWFYLLTKWKHMYYFLKRYLWLGHNFRQSNSIKSEVTFKLMLLAKWYLCLLLLKKLFVTWS